MQAEHESDSLSALSLESLRAESYTPDQEDSAETQMAVRARHLEVLHNFALSQGSLNTLEEIVWNIAKTAIAELSFEDCVVYLLDDSMTILNQVAAHGKKNPSDAEILNPIQIKVGAGIVGAVAATGEYQRVRDTRKDPRYIVDDESRLSELAVPITYKGRVIGVLDSEHQQVDFYTDEHVQLFTTIASLASTRIDTALTMNKLEATVSELKAAEASLASRAEELKRATEDAVRASQAKSHFLASISHEIRTPMTAIVGFSELLTRRDAEEAALQSWSALLKRNADHLLGIIDNVLDLSKIESGTLVADLESSLLYELLNDVMELMKPRADSKGLSFDLVIEDPVPARFVTDRFKFKEILLNLLSNAIKYTPQGNVTLRVSYQAPDQDNQAKLALTVEDSGIGMAAEAVKQLFTPFSRVQNQQINTNIEGTGLGLAIAKGFADLLDGKIQVKTDLEQGSAFTLILDIDDCPSSGMIEASETALLQAKSVVGHIDPTILSGRTILLCEDSSTIALLLTLLLEEAGARVIHCENGAIGVERCLVERRNGRAPDLVLMDIQMPIMDGYEASRTLRSQGFSFPIVALTAFSMAEDRAKCLLAGCNSYLQKPIKPSDFVAEISRQLQSMHGARSNG